MPAPPPHEGPCKRSGDGAEHNDDVPGLGRFRGICGVCRPIVAQEQAAKRASADPIEEELRSRTTQPQLSRVVQELVPLARRLEKAIDDRKAAQLTVRAELQRFKEGLTLVSRVAQSMLNQTKAADQPDE